MGKIDTFVKRCRKVYEETDILLPKIHGWSLHQEQFEDIFKAHPIRSVIEVGSWLGKSTILFANLLQDGGKVYAIDHWKGSFEHQIPGSYANTLLPTLYQQFISNVVHCRLTDKIVPVKLESLEAAKKFKELGITADLIYIDATHDFYSVLNDVSTWYPLLRRGGVFCGDDWTWDGVSGAVSSYAQLFGLGVEHQGDFWRFTH